MNARQLSRQQFTDMTGISPASLSNIFNDKSKPTINHVEAIMEAFPSVNPAWLIRGAGQMFLQGESAASVPQTEQNSRASGEPLMVDFDAPAPPVAKQPPAKRAVSAQQERALNAAETAEPPAAKEVKTVEIRRRKITEIRIFYDDQTWETFVPQK